MTQTTGKDLTIDVNGVTICYDDLGKANTPIIFIHGFPFDKSSWQPQMDFLKKTNRVIAYDIRGFGKSTAGSEKESISLFADDLVKFMEGLEINTAVVCGLSMGGYIILNAVSRYPEKFKAIILSDTQCIADTSEIKEKRNATIMQIVEGKVGDFADGFIKNVFHHESLDTKKEVVEKIRSVILSTSRVSLTETLRALAQRREMCSSLTKIKVPVLLLCGKQDTITPPAQTEFLYTSIENSEMHIIDKAGHLSNLEQPEEFNQQLKTFISQLPKS